MPKESTAEGFGGPDASAAGLSSSSAPSTDSAPAASESSSAKSTTGTKVMAYKGRSVTKRIISVDDMKAQGFDIPEDLVWSRQNGHAVDVSGLSDKAVEFLLKDKQLELREG